MVEQMLHGSINERRTQIWQEFIIVIQMEQKLIAQIVEVMQLLMMTVLYVVIQIVLTVNAHLNEQPDDIWSKQDSWHIKSRILSWEVEKA